MSFYTSLHFYRPTTPPIITGPSLAAFIQKLDATGLLKHPCGESLSVKFGTRVDQDLKEAYWEEPVPGLPGMTNLRSIDWDIEHGKITLAKMVQVLEKHDRPVYRVSVAIGAMVDQVVHSLQTTRPNDGEANLCLWDVQIQLGPVFLGTIRDEEEFTAGWIDVSMSGNGYLYPWMPRDLTDRADQLAALDPLKTACRSTWPVPPDACPAVLEKLSRAKRCRETREYRRRMGPLYPYDDLDRPWDWTWGVSESG